MEELTVNNKKVGLALSGGATLGAVHIGVIRALDEAGVKIDYISGTSIGALVGAFFAFCKNYDFIQDVALRMSWKDIASISISKYGLFANTKIEKLIEKHIGKVSCLPILKSKNSSKNTLERSVLRNQKFRWLLWQRIS